MLIYILHINNDNENDTTVINHIKIYTKIWKPVVVQQLGLSTFTSVDPV